MEKERVHPTSEKGKDPLVGPPLSSLVLNDLAPALNYVILPHLSTLANQGQALLWVLGIQPQTAQAPALRACALCPT